MEDNMFDPNPEHMQAALRIHNRGLDALEFVLYKPGQNKTLLRAIIRSIREKAMYAEFPKLEAMLKAMNKEGKR